MRTTAGTRQTLAAIQAMTAPLSDEEGLSTGQPSADERARHAEVDRSDSAPGHGPRRGSGG